MVVDLLGALGKLFRQVRARTGLGQPPEDIQSQGVEYRSCLPAFFHKKNVLHGYVQLIFNIQIYLYVVKSFRT